MSFNSMMPLWRELETSGSDASHLLVLYSAINDARSKSRALRSSNRFFLNLQNNVPQQQIFSVAKFERRNAEPNVSDVIFAFVNLTVASDEETLPSNWFNVNVDADNNGVNDFSVSRPDHLYNVKNIAAYTALTRVAVIRGCGAPLDWELTY